MSSASLVIKPHISNTTAEGTPPDTPTNLCFQSPVLLELTQDVVDKLQLLVPKAVEAGSSVVEVSTIPAYEDSKPNQGRTRASKMEYKSVNETWDKSTLTYAIAEPVLSTDVQESDQYLFIHRKRIDRKTMMPTSYVDVKSKELQHVLVEVLAGVRGICIREDKPTVEANLLYSFLPELKLYQTNASEDATKAVQASQLKVMLDFIDSSYASITKRLESLFGNGEITYDLLWALFKPNADIYTTCPGTSKPMCVRCNHGEEKLRANGAQYFCLEARRFDYDGKLFGEALFKIPIEKFRGAKRIDLLDSFPIQYHRNLADTRDSLIKNGRRFVSLIGGNHHCSYQGQAFWKDDKGEIHFLFVGGRIVVDAEFFRRINPNYSRPPIEHVIWDHIVSLDSDGKKEDITNSEVPPHELKEGDLLICSPTVLGFSLKYKQWLEFAVADISEIDWDVSSFDRLEIPTAKKEVIRVLSEAHLIGNSHGRFDDFVQGKGRGIVSLLHGPPGVGKTLTAEALSEHLQRPLYMVPLAPPHVCLKLTQKISAGELGTNPKEVEKTLTQIFEIASHWKAVLLLDEADVFVEQRTTSDVFRNALVCVFLRKLEYYEGLLFLTTNRVQTIDEAMASRIHLPLRYDDLDQSAREKIWKAFLTRGPTNKSAAQLSAKDFKRLAKEDLNGREIKNAMSVAQALANDEEGGIRLSHLEQAIASTNQFQLDFRGAGQVENMHSYV